MREVELLRRAASLMRERAQEATPGPWLFYDDGLVWAEGRPGDPVCGSSDLLNSEHIASWDPAVALDVADLMDHAADALEQDIARFAARDFDATDFLERVFEPSLNVARAYLREVPDAS